MLGHQLQYKGVDTRADPADALPGRPAGHGDHGQYRHGGRPRHVVRSDHRADTQLGQDPDDGGRGGAVYDRNTLPYFWRLFPPDSANGTAMVLWAQRQKYTRVAAVFGTDSGSQGDLPGVIASLKALHLNLVANVSHPGPVVI